ncbi:hypothetical protein JCM8202v2_000681 [Rhodotorula sphaerocarpa]
MSPLLHPALSTSLSKSFGLNSPFSLAAMSSSLKDMSSSPGFSSMGMSLGRSFEERPKIEAQFFKNFTCCGLDLHDLHGLLEHFEECHVTYDDEEGGEDDGMDDMDAELESEGTISGPPSPRLVGQVPSFELKKSGLSAFETPESPASPALHLDGGMEFDMEMGDDDSSPSSAGSASAANGVPAAGAAASNAAFGQGAPPISAFDPLHGTASKKRSSPPAASFPPPTSNPGVQLPPTAVDFGSRSRSASAQAEPTTSTAEKEAEEAEALSYLNPAAVNSPMGVTNNSALFPGSPGTAAPGSATADSSAAQNAQQGSTQASTSGQSLQNPGVLIDDYDFDDGIEAVQETDSEDDADRYDVADDDESFATMHFGATPYDQAGDGGSPNSHAHRPNKGKHSGNGSLPPLPGSSSAQAMINPQDPATISALANTTLRDPRQTAAAIAALGPNSLAALPTAQHPLGQGVQISPSGRPYTPPSEKPFKCTVPGCDKSYKQQNGLKYHRLHGHCGQNMPVQEEPGEKVEGKPYVCHVSSCGKRYKNMNGLRYHYQHSGAHGALGLQMLAQGCHPAPSFPPGHKRGFATGSGLQLGGHHQLAQSFTASSSNASSRASSPAAGAYRGVDASGLSAALSRF